MYINRRESNIQTMEETLRFIEGNERLKEAVRASEKNLRLYSERPKEIPEGKFDRDAEIIVTSQSTARAASGYDASVLLVFASATHPGGGARSGSSAQEESLCRLSTLLPVLESKKALPYYERHRRLHDPWYTDSGLLVPGVVFFREDGSGNRILGEEKWSESDCIVVAAPNLSRDPDLRGDEKKRYLATMESRIDTVFRLAAISGKENLVLGAFGCGVFANPPEEVARLFGKVQSSYLRHFRTIEYAIYATRMDDRNLEAFRRALG